MTTMILLLHVIHILDVPRFESTNYAGFADIELTAELSYRNWDYYGLAAPIRPSAHWVVLQGSRGQMSLRSSSKELQTSTSFYAFS